MMLFIIKSAVTLALLYCCVFVPLRKSTFHRFNRMMLFGIILAALVVPMLHISTDHPTVINEGMKQMERIMEGDNAVVSDGNPQEPQSMITWGQAIKWFYLTGLAALLTITLVQIIRLVRLMRGGTSHKDDQGNTIILINCDIPPFSIFRFVVMSVKDYDTERHYILTHEREHIRLGHSYDLMLLLLMKIIQWFNPFVWFISRDLKTIHEYEADQAVIRQGIDAKAYQLFIVTKVVGIRLQPFTNNLNHGSLKKRITMMYQKKSSRWSMLKALLIIPVTALAISSFATLGNIESIKETASTQEDPPFAIHPVRDQYGRITGFSHEGKPADSDFECTYEYVFINGRPATEEEVKNYQTLPFKTYSILKTADGSPQYNYKDKHGIICFILEEDRIDSLVNRLPGVKRETDGSFTVNGKRVKKILVDGKDEWTSN